MWGATDKSGAARPAAHAKRRKSDKARNRAPSGDLPRDKSRRPHDLQVIADSFGMTVDQFMAEIKRERVMARKLTALTAHFSR